MSNVEELTRIVERLNEVLDREDGGALPSLAAAGRTLNQLERIDPEAAKWRELLEPAVAGLEELGRAVAPGPLGQITDTS